MPRALYVGVMSGTSADGIDACLVGFEPGGPHLRGHVHRPYPAALRRAALAAAEAGDLAAVTELDVRLADEYAAAVEALLAHCGIERTRVRAIGCHGQTVLHRPDGPCPTSVQAGDPHRLAIRTGIDVVADFRRADMAAGGQGAPLAPAFHAAAFASADEPRAIINIGGMANVTLLPTDGRVTGFDTGPGNVLLDAWIERHGAEPYDRNGRWAASGETDTGLLADLMADPYFAQAPPKSTGREYFNARWLDDRLGRRAGDRPADVQATLAELTARSIASALAEHGNGVTRAMVCGGGAYNEDLMARLRAAMPERRVETTAVLGIAPECVEPVAFAWLAYRRVRGLPGNRPEVTGARVALCLGALVRATAGEDKVVEAAPA